MGMKTIFKIAGATILGGAAALGVGSAIKDFKKSDKSDETKDESDEDGDMRTVEDALNNKSSDD